MGPLRHALLSGANAASKNSIPGDSELYSRRSAARPLAPMRRVSVSITFRPTVTVCAIPISRPKVCALPPEWSRPDVRWRLAPVSNAPVCIGLFQALTPSSLSAAQNSVVVFKTFGSADLNAGPPDPSLSSRAPAGLILICPSEKQSNHSNRVDEPVRQDADPQVASRQ